MSIPEGTNTFIGYGVADGDVFSLPC